MTGTLFVLSILLLILQRPPEQGTVSITLVDDLGYPIPESVASEFKLTNRRYRRIVFTSSRPSFDSVPYGEYDLQVSAGRGFASTQRTIQVNRSDVWMILALPVGSVESPYARDVIGRVRGISRDGLRWVKLVSLYSDVVESTKLDGQGSFKFAKVPFGRYALITMKDRQACDMRLIEIVYAPTDIVIELNETSPCR
jgi:hypothetical protein